LEVELYPNPAKDALWLNAELPQNQTLNIQMYSIQGKMIQQKTIEGTSGIQQYDLSDFIKNITNGVYVIRVQSNQKTKEIKFVKL